VNVPADLVAAWDHLAVAQESVDQAAHTPASVETRLMALHDALVALLAVEHVVLRHVAAHPNRSA
jgi:hypothetical protein